LGGHTRVAIIGFSFGAPAAILSNKLLARIISEQAGPLGASLAFVSFDIPSENFPERVKAEYMEDSSSTWRFSQSAARWAAREEVTEIIIIAAGPHRWRCERDLRRAIRETKARINVFCCQEGGQYPEEEWFCPDSTRPQTRSQESWERRERIIRWLPFPVYKLISRLAGS
jgi:hypothetical protein